jgi:hypothetical protein
MIPESISSRKETIMFVVKTFYAGEEMYLSYFYSPKSKEFLGTSFDPNISDAHKFLNRMDALYAIAEYHITQYELLEIS